MNNQELQNRIQALESVIQQLQTEKNSGIKSSAQVNFSDILGFIETVTVAPVLPPQNVYDQLKIFSGVIYFYDVAAHVWRTIAISGAVTSINSDTHSSQTITGGTGISVTDNGTGGHIIASTATGATGTFYAASTSGGSPTHLVTVTNGLIVSIA